MRWIYLSTCYVITRYFGCIFNFLHNFLWWSEYVILVKDIIGAIFTVNIYIYKCKLHFIYVTKRLHVQWSPYTSHSVVQIVVIFVINVIISKELRLCLDFKYQVSSIQPTTKTMSAMIHVVLSDCGHQTIFLCYHHDYLKVIMFKVNDSSGAFRLWLSDNISLLSSWLF